MPANARGKVITKWKIVCEDGVAEVKVRFDESTTPVKYTAESPDYNLSITNTDINVLKEKVTAELKDKSQVNWTACWLVEFDCPAMRPAEEMETRNATVEDARESLYMNFELEISDILADFTKGKERWKFKNQRSIFYSGIHQGLPPGCVGADDDDDDDEAFNGRVSVCLLANEENLATLKTLRSNICSYVQELFSFIDQSRETGKLTLRDLWRIPKVAAVKRPARKKKTTKKTSRKAR